MATSGAEAKVGRGRLIHSERGAVASADLFESDAVVDAYADGVAQVMIAPAVSKLMMFTTDGVRDDGGSSVEERVVTLRVAMPTAALMEFCVNTLKSLKSRKGEFEKNNAAALVAYNSAVDSLK